MGWRKLLAWFLVWVLTVATMKFGDIGNNAKDVLIYVTNGFFFANAMKPLANGIYEKYRAKEKTDG